MKARVELPELVVITRHPEFGDTSWREFGWRCPDMAQATLLKDISDEKQPLSPEGILHCTSHAKLHYERYGAADLVLQSQLYRAQSLAPEQFKRYTPSERHRVDFMTTHLLNERSYGKIWGMTEEEVHAKYPKLKSEYESLGRFHGSFPGGTSLKDVFDNMAELRKRYFAGFAGKKVFMNAHMGNILALRALLEDWTEKDVLRALSTASKEILNCSATSYRYNADLDKLVLEDKYYPL